jgi:Na+-driven multidrug efflux pump
MKTRGERDLTTGSIRKQILLFFIPVFFSSLFQQLYNTADAIIVGQFAGKQALAAIDAGGGLTRLFVNFFVGISSGATIIISQYFGRKKVDDISKIVYTAIALAVTAGIGLTIFGILFSPFCLKLMNVPSDIIGTSIHYTQIYFLGFIASLLYNFGSGILRAVGNTKGPM